MKRRSKSEKSESIARGIERLNRFLEVSDTAFYESRERIVECLRFQATLEAEADTLHVTVLIIE